MEKKIFTVLISIILTVTGHIGDSHSNQSSYEGRLYTPTYITQIDKMYFIVDCWQHRVIYSDDIEQPIRNWKVLDGNLGGPHSVATDGELLVVDNTGFNKVNVYAKDKNKGYKLIQEIDNIGSRPHRVIYSPESDRFYVLDSVSTDMHVFENNSGKLELEFIKPLEFLEGRYTRSFRIIDNRMYFVSGASKIAVINYLDDSFEVLEEYEVTEELAGMNDIYKAEDYYYITATPQKFIRTKNLEGLKDGMYEDLFAKYEFKGTPYYFQEIGDYIYLPEITEHSSISRFKVKNNEIYDFERLHDFGVPTEESEKRRSEFPT